MRALLQYEIQKGVVVVGRTSSSNNLHASSSTTAAVAPILQNPSAAMGLLWMRRAGSFQHQFNLRLLQQPNVDTVTAALQAYGTELQPFHSWPLQQIFQVAFYTTATPRLGGIVGSNNNINNNITIHDCCCLDGGRGSRRVATSANTS